MRGRRPRTFAAGMASAGPPSTSGRPSSAAWRGAAAASWLLSWLGITLAGWIGYLIADFIGACILIAIGCALSGGLRRA